MSFDYNIEFEMHSAMLNQLDLHPAKWNIVPGTSCLITSTRVLAGWLLHIAIHPDDVMQNDRKMVMSLVESLNIDDLITVAHIVSSVTHDWLDQLPSKRVLIYLQDIAHNKM